MAEDTKNKDGEQTNETDTDGKKTNPSSENPDEPKSLYEKTEAIVSRQEEANKKTEELLKRQETLYANQRLAGTSGGQLKVQKVETDKEYNERIEKEISEGKHED